jgi:lipopolysaccharide biosynthesis regulator YciM
MRAVEANPQVLLVHLEVWRTLRAMSALGSATERYIATAEEAVFYRDPHICTTCRYRADDMLWRCPHCHEWDTLVEERLSPSPEER